MKIEMKTFYLKQIAEGFKDDPVFGAHAMDGHLNIRPEYQREFVYDDKRRNAVVQSALKNRPLNVFYFVDNGNGNYSVLDGQQRLISLCSFINGEYSIDYQKFEHLSEVEQNTLLNYPCMVYVCTGTEKEILDWFRTINISSEPLTEQELRNTAYMGRWLTKAKAYFSKRNGPAYQLGEKYLTGSAIRQDYLETAIKWVAESKGQTIEEYMDKHMDDPNIAQIQDYFESTISWIKQMFPTYDKTMKGLNWGYFYRTYKDDTTLDPAMMDIRRTELMMDDEVTSKKGIYEYLLSHEKTIRLLNIRTFSEAQKTELYVKCGGRCPLCQAEGEEKVYAQNEMDADHILPWAKGGKTEVSNGRMLCIKHNRMN